jgi:hypothetical protein
MEMNEKMAREYRRKLEVEMNRREAEIVEHWRREIEVIYRKKHDGMASLQIDLKALMERMANRVTILGRMVREES